MAHTSESPPMADQSDMFPSGLWKSLQSPLTLALVCCGGIGALLFTVTYLIEGFTRPSYDAWKQAIAALSLGPNGWVLILTLAVGCFAFAQYALIAHSRGWFVYSLITGVLILIFWGSFWSGTFVGLVPLAGLAERLSAGSHALWLCVLVATLFFKRTGQRISSSTPKWYLLSRRRPARMQCKPT